MFVCVSIINIFQIHRKSSRYLSQRLFQPGKMKFFSGYVGLLFHEIVAREGHSWEAGRWIPNSNFEMAGNNRNQDPNLLNYGNGAGTKSGSTVPSSLYGYSYNTKQLAHMISDTNSA